nr:hypothetical protein [uncultured Rhodopila sp.]
MTELHKPGHLREIARVLDQPVEQDRRLVPVLQWSVSPETGRPVGRWTVNAEGPG